MRGLIDGCLAGLAATVPMTATMGRLHRRLTRRERYAVPPREIVSAAGAPDSAAAALLALFGRDDIHGALFALQPRRPLFAGSGFGVAVRGASSLGRMPALGLLEPGQRHPDPRNAPMLAAHVVRGATRASGLRETGLAEPAFRRRSKPLCDLIERRRAIR